MIKKNSVLKFFCMNSRKSLLGMIMVLFTVSACIQDFQPRPVDPLADKYNADNLARDWRQQVRKNPVNPYEGYSYPADNDAEYYYPKKRIPKKSRKPTQNNQPYYDSQPGLQDNDSYYGKYPRYNSEDDNQVIDSKNFPLYLD